VRVSFDFLVLRCKNISVRREFYEKLGLMFINEKHGNGPEHYSSEIDGVLIELYPLQENEHVDRCRVGFSVTSFLELTAKLTQDESIEIVEMVHELNERLVMIVKDPDGRTVEISDI